MKPFGHHAGTRTITLKPGQLFFGRGNLLVYTLLGSCVAITLWHPQKRLGGMCHYLLPQRDDYQANTHLPDGYFATDAIRYFADRILRAGAHARQFEVKVFGGGNMFDEATTLAQASPVARNNIDQGLRLLALHGFRVANSDLGGARYRKVYFDLSQGDLWVQYGKHSPMSREAG